MEIVHILWTKGNILGIFTSLNKAEEYADAIKMEKPYSITKYSLNPEIWTYNENPHKNLIY